jgi:hypothetical protein
MWGAQWARAGGHAEDRGPTQGEGDLGIARGRPTPFPFCLIFLKLDPRSFWAFGTRALYTGGPAPASRGRGPGGGVQLATAGTHVWLIDSIIRRMRTRAPTCLSVAFGIFLGTHD